MGETKEIWEGAQKIDLAAKTKIPEVEIGLCDIYMNERKENWCIMLNVTWKAMCMYITFKRVDVRLRLKCDGTRAETRFRLSAKRTSPFKSAGGRQFSRLLTAEVCASAGYTMLRGSVKSTDYPLYSPVSPSLLFPYVTVCHHISTGFYHSCSGKDNVYYVLWLCFWILIQHAVRLRRIVSLVWTRHVFSALSHRRHHFR